MASGTAWAGMSMSLERSHWRRHKSADRRDRRYHRHMAERSNKDFVSPSERKLLERRLRDPGGLVDLPLRLGRPLSLPIERASVLTFLSHHVASYVLKSLARGAARTSRCSLAGSLRLLHDTPRAMLGHHHPVNRLATPAPAMTSVALKPMKARRCCFTTSLV
jgi:hypothetical protein